MNNSSPAEPINPYAPTVNVDHDEGWELTGQTLDAASVRFIRVGRTVVTWEKLRLLYNLILACVTVVMCGILLFSKSFSFNLAEKLVEISIAGMIIANACFCLGPLIDGYLSWFGWRSPAITWGLFLLGTLISIPLAAFAIVALIIPN